MRPALARSLAAALAACALGACGAKDAPPPMPGSASAGTDAGPPGAEQPAPRGIGAPAAGGSFPEACGEYRRTIERLARCGDALPPEARDNLRALFERQWAGWEKLPEQDRRALAAICKSSSDIVRDAAAAACGW
jgi:hypothetical protein